MNEIDVREQVQSESQSDTSANEWEAPAVAETSVCAEIGAYVFTV